MNKKIVNEADFLSSAKPERSRVVSHVAKPKIKKDVLRFVPLGGLEEIGRNMMFFEYQDEIVAIDAGLQFPEDETPGIDFIIPNTAYLEQNKHKIKAMIITHAHLDHIGALPYIMEKIGNPPIYTTNLSRAIIEKRHEEFPNVPKLKFEIVKDKETRRISENFSAEFFNVPHTIPDAVAVLLKTPVGNMCNLGDFKVERKIDGSPIGLIELERVGKLQVDALFMDSTGASKPGESMSEELVEKNLEKLFKETKGRIIIGTFASLLGRLDQILQIANKLGRKVAVSGRSMKTNIQLASNAGYMNIPKEIIIPLEDLHKYKDDKILILSTGMQGEANASLMRVINGEHKHIKIKPGDTVFFSSSIVPGNERSVQTLKDNLARQGAIVFDSSMDDIHASGHGPKEDIKQAIKLLNPKYFFPIHGYYFMRHTNVSNAVEAGVKEANCFVVDNGQVVEIGKNKVEVSKETVPAHYVMVDGLGVGDVGEVVLRDRIMLSQEGMVVVIVTLDRHSGKVLKNPDIISRGFIYLKDNREILDEMRKKIKGLIARMSGSSAGTQQIDADYLKGVMRDQIGQLIFRKTKRRPMILPVVIEI
ncbi:MAG: ribonuclease J [Candidatus Liptonbacteria bacterium CG11_big_fil_rev_8_21_14_0_20_35_14]|uniref:Ribonuclease J n=1 Tax=Candidatus Liptonbacteria bacterium CG11_big_fil_rev_8_21_14_0_20_35_14 TaxID=1974634 RepID=A0A2H0N7Y2_9BACT|nr:MAG: ribonuclease J [Candidatus Liptonbacteria bacterium CG11_big_fil_rev_8_21_14_0_20_35_14]